MQVHTGSPAAYPQRSAARAPDDRPFRLLSGAPLDTRQRWPFPPLSPLQDKAHREQHEALQAGDLRGLPTCFGDLS